MTATIAVHANLKLGGSITFDVNHSGFPVNPQPRQMIVKDNRPYMYAEISTGFFSWMPMYFKQSAYVHSQGEPALVWTLPHNLNSTDYAVFVYDTNHQLQSVSPELIDANTLQITLNEALAGSAVVFTVENFGASTASFNTIEIGAIDLTEVDGKLLINGDEVVLADDVYSINEINQMIGSLNTVYAAANHTHALATTESNGFMSAQDKVDLATALANSSAAGTLRRVALNPATGTQTVNLDLDVGDVFVITAAATGQLTVNFTNALSGTGVSVALVEAKGFGARTVIWGAPIVWSGNTLPSDLTADNTKTDLFAFIIDRVSDTIFGIELPKNY